MGTTKLYAPLHYLSRVGVSHLDPERHCVESNRLPDHAGESDASHLENRLPQPGGLVCERSYGDPMGRRALRG